MNLGPCPWCGDVSGVYQALRLDGRARRAWRRDGRKVVVAVNRDSLKYTPHSDAVHCRQCKHIRRDWVAVDGELVRGEGE